MIRNNKVSINQHGISSVFVVLGIVLVVGVSYLVYKSDTQSSDQNNNVSQPYQTPPSPTPFPIDTVNDGVYTNYKYGFRFKYPADKFSIVYSHEDYGQLILYDDDKSVYIKLGMSTYTDKLYDSHRSIYRRNKDNPIEGYTILSEETKRDHTLSILYTKSAKGIGIDGNSAYSAMWWFEDKPQLTTLYFFSSTLFDDFVKENKAVFDEIVGSMEFFDPDESN